VTGSQSAQFPSFKYRENIARFGREYGPLAFALDPDAVETILALAARTPSQAGRSGVS